MELLEAKNLPQDCIEHFLVNESLGFYKDVNITVKGFDLLKYRIPIELINNITPFYTVALNIWYSIEPIYFYKDIADFHKSLIWYNPYLTDKNGEVLEPIKARVEVLNCDFNTIDSILNRPFINCKRVVRNYLKKVKPLVQNIEYKQAEENSYVLTKIQEIKININDTNRNSLKEKDPQKRNL